MQRCMRVRESDKESDSMSINDKVVNSKCKNKTAYVSDGNCDFDVDVGVNVDVILPAYPPSNRLT